MTSDDFPRGAGDPDFYGYPGEHQDNEPIGEYQDKDGKDVSDENGTYGNE